MFHVEPYVASAQSSESGDSTPAPPTHAQATLLLPEVTFHVEPYLTDQRSFLCRRRAGGVFRQAARLVTDVSFGCTQPAPPECRGAKPEATSRRDAGSSRGFAQPRPRVLPGHLSYRQWL